MTERRVHFDSLIWTTKNTFIKAQVFGSIPDDTNELVKFSVEGLVVDKSKHPYIKNEQQIAVYDVLVKVC